MLLRFYCEPRSPYLGEPPVVTSSGIPVLIYVESDEDATKPRAPAVTKSKTLTVVECIDLTQGRAALWDHGFERLLESISAPDVR